MEKLELQEKNRSRRNNEDVLNLIDNAKTCLNGHYPENTLLNGIALKNHDVNKSLMIL